MSLLVPFDGTDLAAAALLRASEFGAALDAPVLAVGVVPAGNEEYAREKGWLDDGEPFRREAVVAHLRDRVTAVAPEATFRVELVDRFAARGTIAGRIRDVAAEVDAELVFVGSENAGRLVTSITSVGSSVAADDSYDVVIVREPAPEAESRRPRRPRSLDAD